GRLRLAQQQADAMEAADGMLRANLAGAPGGLSAAPRDRGQRQPEAVGVPEGEHGLAEALDESLVAHAMFDEALQPVAECSVGHAPDRLLGLADAEPAGGDVRPGEESQDCPRMARLIPIVEVVGAGIIEIHGLLDQAQAEGPRVELEVPLSLTGDGGDVVEPAL